jgi:hypothetical protein
VQTSLQAVRAQPSTLPNPLALWHLLSLDAPTVAALWTWFVARAVHVPLPPAIPGAMFLAVWLLYSTDRLLDSRSEGTGDLELRHLFHREHRRVFSAAIVAVSLALIPLLRQIPADLFRRYSVLAALLLLWFVLIHLAGQKKSLPKEIVPGPFFAAAIFMPIFEPAMLPSAAAFALLCTLNCLSIYAWEHPSPVRAPSIAPLRWVGSAHLSTRLGTRLLTPLGIVTTVLPLTLLPTMPVLRPILLAISLAAALLLALDRLHSRLEPTNLRAAADLVLLTPLLLAPFLR